MAGRISILKYMATNIQDHVDRITGEVNATTLAEDACWMLEPELQEVPEKYFDYAEELAIAYEIKTGIKEGKVNSGMAGLINSLPADYF